MKWAVAIAALVALLAGEAHSQSLAVLPNARTTFVDTNGAPLVGGRVYFYVPGTTTPAPTWLDPYQSTLNGNPVVLDSAGRASIFGTGVYRQVVQDMNGNTVWDQLTLSAAVPVGTGTGLYVFQTGPTIISPALTGTPTAVTQALGDASTSVATDAFVAAAVAAIVPPVNGVPSGAVLAFNLATCPAGWVTANGTGGTADVRGVVVRGLDLGHGQDTSGTPLGGYEGDTVQNHTHGAPGGGFLTLTGGTIIGSSGAVTTFDTNGGTGGMNSGNAGSETRVKATVLLYCQKS